MNAIIGGGYICVMTVYCYAWVVVVCMYNYIYIYIQTVSDKQGVSK